MKKRILDLFIIALAVSCAGLSYYQLRGGILGQWCITVFAGTAVLGLIDLVWQCLNRQQEEVIEFPTAAPGGEDDVSEVILLDEKESPIKSWSLIGKTSVVIGRENKYENVDIDLTECEYNALIDFQHAVLNFSMEQWYIEDLYSKNGIRIRKVQDNICYKVSRDKPCLLKPGDIIMIANTKLLFT